MTNKVYIIDMIVHTSWGICLCFCVAILGLSACASTKPLADVITVEGEVWARGNAPFRKYVLTTGQQNHYVLNLEDMAESSFQTPVQARVVGYVYVDQWNGDRFAHLRVSEIEWLGEQ